MSRSIMLLWRLSLLMAQWKTSYWPMNIPWKVSGMAGLV
ncbi:hypothetical protein Egran_00020 [Elaphomyces granulatus]|uniref:Uncharacterized protein n=1 Tax=Elaphomyces granulatus TaxID=519963 RepID=A0A232M732_9EURO|nr:hypothetical protein Egran_00020 [Elaphomyces granulatus]